MISALKLLKIASVCYDIFLLSTTDRLRCLFKTPISLAWSPLIFSSRRSLYIISFFSLRSSWVESSQALSSFFTVSEVSLGQGEKEEMMGVVVLWILHPLWGDFADLDLPFPAQSSLPDSSKLFSCLSFKFALSISISFLSSLFSSLHSLICYLQYSISSLQTSLSVFTHFSQSISISLFKCILLGTLTSMVGGTLFCDLDLPLADSLEQSYFFHLYSCRRVTSFSRCAFFSCRILMISSWLLHLLASTASNSHFYQQSYLQVKASSYYSCYSGTAERVSEFVWIWSRSCCRTWWGGGRGKRGGSGCRWMSRRSSSIFESIITANQELQSGETGEQQEKTGLFLGNNTNLST